MLTALIDKTLPGHIGSLSRPLYLKRFKKECSLADATAAFGVEQLITIVAYCLTLVFSSIFLLIIGAASEVVILESLRIVGWLGNACS